MAILKGFWEFYSVRNAGGQFTLAGSPKAQLIMPCLQHELRQSASPLIND
jgi:hypothetical protein